MYNKECKERYLQLLAADVDKKVIDTTRSQFLSAEYSEMEFQKDLCNFSIYEIRQMYSVATYNSPNTFRAVNSTFRKYTQWCIENNLVDDGVNHYLEIRNADFAAFINKKFQSMRFLTREEFYALIEQFPCLRDRFAAACIFEFGKSRNYSDITEMEISDIDEIDLTVNLDSGRTVSISKEFVNLAYNANEEKVYDFNSVKRTAIYIPSSKIFKKTRDTTSSSDAKFISHLIKVNLDVAGGYMDISAESISLSGQFEMIRSRSRELGLGYKDYLKNYYSEVQYQYNLGKSTPYSVYYRNFKDYL